jgi:NAD(P)H-hydrate epimerase
MNPKQIQDRDLILTRDQVRNCDRIAIERFHVPGIVLMENAGSAAARWINGELARRSGQRVCILAGPGNNGGDGFVVARHLANDGVDVEILLLVPAEKIKGDAAINFEIVRAMEIPLHLLGNSDRDHVAATVRAHASQADVIVDALLGTGATGEPREPIRTAIETLNALNRPVVAIDTPSGLDCDTGEPLGPAVRAVATVTFAAMKKGLAHGRARDYTGPVQVASIGIATQCLFDVAQGQAR